MNKEIEVIAHKQWGYSCPEETTIVSFLGEKVAMTTFGAKFEVDSKEKKWFLKKLKKIGIDKWEKSRWEPQGKKVLDGIEWSLSVCYVDGSEKEFSGYEAYPPNYHKLMKLLGIE